MQHASVACALNARELTRAVEYTLASLAKSMLDEHREEFASSEVAGALLSLSMPLQLQECRR